MLRRRCSGRIVGIPDKGRVGWTHGHLRPSGRNPGAIRRSTLRRVRSWLSGCQMKTFGIAGWSASRICRGSQLDSGGQLRSFHRLKPLADVCIDAPDKRPEFVDIDDNVVVITVGAKL